MIRRFCAHATSLNRWRKTAGLLQGVRWSLVKLSMKLGLAKPDQWTVRPKQVQYPLTVRLAGASDMNVFDQIFVAEEYACLLDLQQVSIVIDLGAHVGFTAAFFLSCFAGSRLIAVEPDDRNFELCRRNLAPYGDRPRLLHGAVWSRCTELSLSRATSRAGLESARQVKELELEPIPCGGRIEAWDMAALIEMAQCRTVDLLKVDIERAELELFREVAPAWLHKVRNLCIELHGADCEAVFFRSLSAFDYDLCRSGELTICRNIRRKTALTAFPAVR